MSETGERPGGPPPEENKDSGREAIEARARELVAIAESLGFRQSPEMRQIAESMTPDADMHETATSWMRLAQLMTEEASEETAHHNARLGMTVALAEIALRAEDWEQYYESLDEAAEEAWGFKLMELAERLESLKHK